ncbi:hypothetical protein DL96DRAFT_1480833 [Flagelloscypha sp. PMI_526]|nr:hypothetical protein DL96DRAFT_1480833 [Flagelloscypha sp. PMI_526]
MTTSTSIVPFSSIGLTICTKSTPTRLDNPARPNIHISFHLADFLLLFGPLFHWWAFPFERLIGTIQRINTNHQIGSAYLPFLEDFRNISPLLGMLEGTILESYLLGANFRRALSRPNCPVIIQELNALLHKVYPKKRSDSHDAPSSRALMLIILPTFTGMVRLTPHPLPISGTASFVIAAQVMITLVLGKSRVYYQGRPNDL